MDTNIRDLFRTWLDEIDISEVAPRIQFLEDSLFLTFNYTLLLEEVYEIPKKRILHIHGSLDSGDLIFGHNRLLEEEPEQDKNGDSNRTMFSDSIGAAKSLHYSFYKDVNEQKENRGWFNSLRGIKTIYILGHSIDEIDLPYFEEIHNKNNNAEWYVSFHAPNEHKEHIKALSRIGVSISNITCIRIGDLHNVIRS